MTSRLTGGDLSTVADLCVAAVAGAEDADWSAPAGPLTWSCRQTVEHIVDDLIYYAAAVAVQAPRRLVLWAKLEEDAGTPHLAEALGAAAAVLGAVVATAPDAPWTMPEQDRQVDTQGYLALGIAELVLHTHDVAQGLDVPFAPLPEVCERVLERLFPQAEVGSDDPWQVLLWATGRSRLGGRPVVEEWEYRIEAKP